MNKSKLKFNIEFFAWYFLFFQNKEQLLKKEFRQEIYKEAFPFLPTEKAMYKFNNYQQNKTPIPYFTAQVFVEVANKFDPKCKLDLSTLFPES